MTEEDDGAPPPPSKKPKLESEEQPQELFNHDNDSEDESNEIEDEDEDEDDDDDDESSNEDEDERQQSPPPLLDMIDFPLSSPLPPTPPLPSSPRDLSMGEEDSGDEGPPPGWDNNYQLKDQAEQLVTPASISAVSSDIKMEDVPQDVHNEECQPRSQAHTSPAPELVTSDIKEDQQDSEDDGPPPGWDSKCQHEPKLQTACSTISQSDIKMEDVRQDDQNEGQPLSQAHSSPAPELVPSDIQVEEDSEDDGPPPGWDSKCQPEPKIQPPRPTTPQSDIKTEDGQQEDQNKDALQPESKAHSSPAPEIVSSDIKTVDVQQDTRNEDGPQPQSHARPTSPPELVPSDIKVEEQDSEDDGPPPGWDSKCQPEPEPKPKPKLQIACPTNPPSEFKMVDDQQEDEGPPPGWDSTPQQQSQVHSSLPSPILRSGMSYEQKNVKIIEESPQPPSRQGSVPPTRSQISMPKPPTTIDYPEMGQMVCGSCRQLLSYPRGARYVECACCLEENYVLEEHEVGQVVCGSCNVLLMYPYGAPKVKCANCSTETEIGDQNRRPPLSEHKRLARQHLRRVQAG